MKCSTTFGAAAARNRGLADSQGEIIAYLDSDNTWFPGTLAAVVDAFAGDSTCDAVYFAQVRRERATSDAWIHAKPFDAQAMRIENAIDLNAFAHRRGLFERLGGFDPDLTRLIDWDLILRYTAEHARKGAADRGRPLRNRAVVANLDARELSAQPLPRATEARSAGRHTAAGVVRAAALPAAQRDVCGDRDRMHAALGGSRRGLVGGSPRLALPDVATGASRFARRGDRPGEARRHAYPLSSHGGRYRDEVERAGLSATVRGHGFAFDASLATMVEHDPVIRALYILPHLAAACGSETGKIRPMPVCFNPRRFYPGEPKDRRLVVRAASALQSKDIPLFMRVARACPDHRFVLLLVRCNGAENTVEELIEQNQMLGSPVDFRVNAPLDEAAAVVRQAGIYLHTSGLDSTYGMPMSVCEALATGSYVVGRRCTVAELEIGDAGECYDDEEQAVRLIKMTTGWSDEQWHAAQVRAIDRAYGHHVDSLVLAPMLKEWMSVSATAEAVRSSA